MKVVITIENDSWDECEDFETLLETIDEALDHGFRAVMSGHTEVVEIVPENLLKAKLKQAREIIEFYGGIYEEEDNE